MVLAMLKWCQLWQVIETPGVQPRRRERKAEEVVAWVLERDKMSNEQAVLKLNKLFVNHRNDDASKRFLVECVIWDQRST